MLMTLNQMMGMPVVWQGNVVGQVDRGVTDADASRLMGLIIRYGLGAAKWVPSQGINLIGRRCIVASLRPIRLPGQLPPVANRVYRTNGCLLGEITDAVLCVETQRVMALEVSESLLGRLRGQRRYAVDYRIGRTGASAGQAVVTSLLSWAEIQRRFKEERE